MASLIAPHQPLATLSKLTKRSLPLQVSRLTRVQPSLSRNARFQATITDKTSKRARPVTQDSNGTRGPTAIVMLNMGGPERVDQVGDYLSRLFSDPDLIEWGRYQDALASAISSFRTSKIEEQYQKIGGGSPIKKWTRLQGEGMCRILDEISPETAPHKPYIAFRYTHPLTEEMYQHLLEDGFGLGKGGRAVAFSQYPQYSCTTSGSSLNELWRWRNRLEGKRGSGEVDPEGSIKWSVIDRWHTHPGLIEAFAQNIEKTLETFPEDRRDKVTILFSAHSLPMKTVNKGDPYPAEVHATADRIMDRIGRSHPYRVVWQSQVGYTPWLGPQTAQVVPNYIKQGQEDIIIVPVAFTSDHIETLHELDLEIIHETGLASVKRVESLNDNPVFIRALADIAHEHLDSRKSVSKQMMLRCPGCQKESCLEQKRFFADQEKHL